MVSLEYSIRAEHQIRGAQIDASSLLTKYIIFLIIVLATKAIFAQFSETGKFTSYSMIVYLSIN